MMFQLSKSMDYGQSEIELTSKDGSIGSTSAWGLSLCCTRNIFLESFFPRKIKEMSSPNNLRSSDSHLFGKASNSFLIFHQLMIILIQIIEVLQLSGWNEKERQQSNESEKAFVMTRNMF